MVKIVTRTTMKTLIMKARPMGPLSKSADYIVILSLIESSPYRIIGQEQSITSHHVRRY